MPKFYVYITDRLHDSGILGFGHERVFSEIYDAESKDEVKKLVLEDFDYMPKVREKMTAKVPETERFITSIHELNDYWHNIWLTTHMCKECRNQYTKLEKSKFRTGGSTEFCSAECQKQFNMRFEVASVDSYNSATVYMITHRPTGKRYIGVTTRWIMQRWWEHIKAKSGSPFHQLVLASSITDFTFEILEVFKPSEHDPYAREAFYISKYNAVELGLNSVSGHMQE
ncbi:GIY-YIG nuclease family protein [Pseudarthrobacter sp. ATCC 49987]|uniref:GIY-YIG nuclease family protein n=1 Tax=Pseudarthrobacter sp. ATCC 49987 TaxID=2698204 RepID=UPI00136BF757|nr:GIY-YIG nuclease family protein [Pseudarthrobacter sp. ATCC 49987]